MGCYGRFLIQILEKGGEYDVEIAVIVTVRQAKLNKKNHGMPHWHVVDVLSLRYVPRRMYE